jgi:hypothetical protein
MRSDDQAAEANLTLPQARTRFVELIARYFDLGEVRIEPE